MLALLHSNGHASCSEKTTLCSCCFRFALLPLCVCSLCCLQTLLVPGRNAAAAPLSLSNLATRGLVELSTIHARCAVGIMFLKFMFQNALKPEVRPFTFGMAFTWFMVNHISTGGTPEVLPARVAVL